ncbi:MAG: PilZ domain-containing protein [Treponema sp.]|nr:PilZ domain-containing protein [Treponema sp.]
MEINQNPLYGRKVIFLNPVFSTRTVIIPRLVEEEFEVYTIAEYQDAKNVLREFPDALCFINIDDKLSHEQWFNFIMSCKEEIPSIIFGVLSSHMSRTDGRMFMDNAAVAAGFIMMEESLESTTQIIIKILNRFGAKGRRQYVRASCADAANASVQVEHDGKEHTLLLIDISVAGAACILQKQHADFFHVNSMLRNVSVRLGDKSFECAATVYASMPNQNYSKLVLLFSQELSLTAKKIIHDYITSSLQHNVNSIINAHPKDTTDYATKTHGKKNQ